MPAYARPAVPARNVVALARAPLMAAEPPRLRSCVIGWLSSVSVAYCGGCDLLALRHASDPVLVGDRVPAGGAALPGPANAPGLLEVA